ncbi:hypothetical protein XENOCAPTIV_010538 [Xenoophorus captivus]|uniref:Uncharacterized protein n=1 Tax=Xenoophorus captivus TaxID=1517983 RepID=A0ABV0RKE7_9TELE
MLPVNRGIMERERDIDTGATGAHPNAAAGAAVVRGMKRGDPEPDAQTAAALTDLAGAECKRPRIDGSGSVVGDIGQLRHQSISRLSGIFCCCYSKPEGFMMRLTLVFARSVAIYS